jgi:hypothetical protein
LRDTEFVDFAEGTLAAARAAHVEACAECRAQADLVGAALRDASADEMPEPSPLFWEHLSARVRDRVAHETPDPAPWWTMTGVRVLMPLVAALTMVIAVIAMTTLSRMRNTPVPGELASSHMAFDAGMAGADPDLPAAVDDQNAAVWAVLTAAASDIDVDEARAAGMGAHVGAVDHEVTHLNQAELKELDRLLQAELKRSSD